MDFKPGDVVLPVSHTGAEPNSTKNLRINRNLAHATTDLEAAKFHAGVSIVGKRSNPDIRARVFQVEPVDTGSTRESGDNISSPMGFTVVKRVWTRKS